MVKAGNIPVKKIFAAKPGAEKSKANKQAFFYSQVQLQELKSSMK